MKKALLTGIISLGVLISIQAQNSKQNRDSNAGIKAGYNLASVVFNDNNNPDNKPRQGFHIGFYGESFLNDNIALQVELLYSQQGYLFDYPDGSQFTQKIDYINLPLTLKLYPVKFFYIEAGPQIGVGVSHKEEYSGPLFITAQEYDPNRFDWGLNFGLGFKTNAGVSFGARYLLGQGEIYDDKSGSPKNRVLQFSIGIDL